MSWYTFVDVIAWGILVLIAAGAFVATVSIAYLIARL